MKYGWQAHVMKWDLRSFLLLFISILFFFLNNGRMEIEPLTFLIVVSTFIYCIMFGLTKAMLYVTRSLKTSVESNLFAMKNVPFYSF